MPLLNRFDPPGFLPDFNKIPGQVEPWSQAVSNWFDYAVGESAQKIGNGPVQFFNPAKNDPGGIAVEQPITWNAFPKQLLREFGRDVAFDLADRLWHIEQFGAPSTAPDAPEAGSSALYRPQEEYCEWLVKRNPDTNKIDRVTFTSEPPEFWQALAGVVPASNGLVDQHFPSDPERLLQLYRELVDPRVQTDDLIPTQDLKDGSGKVWAPKGQYNIYNKWNTTHGIAHLNSPPNSLVAEIVLGSDASLIYLNTAGKTLVEPEALICYGNYGGANRNSDPTIGSTVNAIARLGAFVTLRNPVGLYMDHIDLSGWEAPDGKGVDNCVRIVRGTPEMIERMVVEVPSGRGFSVGDIMINGAPIRYGGQIAECITVKLVGVGHIMPQPVMTRPSNPLSRGFVDPFQPKIVNTTRPFKAPIPSGTVEAFLAQGAAEEFSGPDKPLKLVKLSASTAARKRRPMNRR
jgi:hypothetical protein